MSSSKSLLDHKTMKTLIIAEAGVNHNGSLELAKQLVDKAIEAKVDYVKFQVGVPELVVSKYADKADYQKETTGNDDTQLDMIRKISLTFDQHRELKEYCDCVGANYLCTPFDLPSIDFLNSIGMDLWKIPSGEITNYPYLKKIAQLGGKIILSTGMSELDEIKDAIDILTQNGTSIDNISLLHCNTEYPTPMCDVNLKAMNALRETFGVEVGYSDHTQGIEVPIAAVAMGATIIEKHFTLDKAMEGPDHKASLDPMELNAMVRSIRNIEQALGVDRKIVSVSERKNKDIARKSIVALREIKQGDVFSEDNITVKRPGNGISPMQWESVLGMVAIRNFQEDELIEL